MKKLLAILLALCMVMSLAACGSDSKDDDKEKDDKKTEAVETGDNAEDETPAKPDKDEGKEEEKEDEVKLPSYDSALDIYAEIVIGDTSNIEATLPSEIWETLAIANETTKDVLVDQLASAYGMLAGIFTKAELEVISEEDASGEIDRIADGLAAYNLTSEIEAAYLVEVQWTYEVAEEYADEMGEMDDDTDEFYVVFIDGAWYVLSTEFEWNILDI